jgi:spore germination protein YaaH
MAGAPVRTAGQEPAVWVEDTMGWDIPMPEIPDVQEVPPPVSVARRVAAAVGNAEASLQVPLDLADRISMHQLEWEQHRAQAAAEGRVEVKTTGPVQKSIRAPRAPSMELQKRVLGWHPYWATTSDIQSYQYSNLTTIAYFSYEVDPVDGTCANLYQWNTSPVVEWAHSNGVKVVLTATLFGAANNQQLLENTTACSTLINDLVNVVSNRGGDGICIDFEDVGSWTGATRALTTFMSNLTVRFHRDIPGSEVSIALPSVDWYADFDVAAYDAFGLDYAVLMGYDYYYAGSATPGPVAPLYSSAQWVGAASWCSVDYSVRYYLNKGLQPDKLLLGVPYYGRQWRAAGTALGAASSGSAYSSAKTYLQAKRDAATHGSQWDANASVPYYTYTSNGFAYQCFFDDPDSLGLKYDLAKENRLGGIGIWNLTQGTGAAELWNLIADRFGPDADEEDAPWEARTSSHSGTFYGADSREGLHVLSGSGGALYASSDGTNWTARHSGVTGLLMGVNGDGPLWVVVGEGGTLLTSPDAVAWTARTSPTNALFRSVAYGNGIYVACGDAGALVYSPDGTNWSPAATAAISDSFQGVAFGDGRFVAVGQNGRVMISTDGQTWSSQALSGGYISDVVHAMGAFVLVGPGSRIFTSTNGTEWTAQTNHVPASGVYLYRVEYGLDAFKTVGAGGAIWTSADGVAWAAEGSFTSNDLRGITFSGDLFVAVGTGGAIGTKSTLEASTGGGEDAGEGELPAPSAEADWTMQTSEHTGGFYGVDSRDGCHVAVGSGGAIYSTGDGSNWMARSSGKTGLLMNINGAGPLWVAVGEGGTILTSSDGTQWTSRLSPTNALLRGVAYGNGAYVACGDGGAMIRSTDGVEWTAVTSGTTLSLQGICFGEDPHGETTAGTRLFVAVGGNGTILTSPDGLAWTSRSGATTYLSDVIYGNGYYVIVGAASRIFRSADGVTWTAQTNSLPNASTYLYRAAYCSGVFKATGAGGAMWTSPDGHVWTAEDAGTSEVLRGISYARDQFVAVGLNGVIRTKGTLQGGTPGGSDGEADGTGGSTGGGEEPGGDPPGPSGIPETVAKQPVGALSGVVVYCSAGHGFGANAALSAWSPERGLLYDINEDMGNIDQLNYFAVDAWKAGATIVPFRPLGYQTNEIVLDNVDTTRTARGQVSFGGTWYDTGQTTLYYGTAGEVGYRYAYTSTTGTSAWASYRPNLPVAGEYPVYTWVRHGSDRVNQLYRIHHAGGVMDVRVHHNQVGNGWVWLGNYYFEAGTNGCVNISNYAPESGSSSDVVIADAIRFGNGMGNVPRGSAGVSGFEQELESSRFWVIKSMGVGMDATLYDLAGYDDRNDNIGQPARMANAMCRTNGWARWRRVYVGFHSNASGTQPNTTARGTWGLYDTRLESTYPAYYRAQTNLAYQIGQRSYTDMQAVAGVGAIPSWGSGTRRTYGGTYGEIYNASVYLKMDTTINEVAFHDHADDCAVLKTPAGREGLARSTTRGLVAHLGLHYAESTVPQVDAPDRPIRLQAVNSGTGSVTVSWSMPVRTAASGDVPTGFVLYVSKDGVSFGNPIPVSGGGAVGRTVSALTPGATLFFRVCATNAGGESLHSAVAGVRVTSGGDRASVLLVDGFKRNDSFLAPTRVFANGLNGPVTLVRPRMINAFDYAKEHAIALAAAGQTFDYTDSDRVNADVLTGYEKVVWILGEEGTGDETFSSAEQAAVSAYLANGGCLMVSGSEMGYDLGRAAASAADRAFLTNMLRSVYVADSSGTGRVTGTSQGILAGLSLSFNYTNLLADHYTVGYPDILAAAAGARLAAVYGQSAAGTSGAVIQFSNDVYRTVVMGFPFESLTDSAQRNTVMARVMDFFEEGRSVEEGSLRVTLTPAAAVSAGAQWRVDGGQWQNSGALVSGLSVGTHEVSYQSASGFVAPAVQNVAIVQGATSTVSAVYAPMTGSVGVLLAPPAAVIAGAQWRVDEGPWQDSGAIVSGLPQGSCTLAFKEVVGYATPPTQHINIVSAATNLLQVEYTGLAVGGDCIVSQGFDALDVRPWGWQVVYLDPRGVQTNETHGAAVQPGGDKTAFGAVALQLQGSSASDAVHPAVLFDNVDISGYTNVVLTLPFAAAGPDANDDLYVAVSYDAGATWEPSAFGEKMADGYNNLSLAYGTLVNTERQPCGTPYQLAVPDNKNQLMVRVAFSNAPTPNNTLDVYYLDEVRLTGIVRTSPPDPETGAMDVVLSPSAAVAAGAQWSLDGGITWRNSGALVEELAPGIYTVTAGHVAGFTAPAPYTVTVAAGATSHVERVYSPLAVGGDAIASQSFDGLDVRPWIWHVIYLNNSALETNVSGGAAVQISTNKVLAGTSAAELQGSTNGAVNPVLVLENLDISGYTNVVLSVPFAANGPDGGDDLHIAVSYDGGSTWQPTVWGMVVADGYSNLKLDYHVLLNTDRQPQQTPYVLQIPDDKTQLMVRLLFFNAAGADNTVDAYYVDEIRLTGEEKVIPSLVLLDEPFDEAETNPPEGWTFNATAWYTASTSSGIQPPSVQFREQGNNVVTPSFVGGTNLAFWAKGQGSVNGRFVIEQDQQGAWSTLCVLTNPSTSGATYNVPLQQNVTRLRFTWEKQSGNLAFDDVRVTGVEMDAAADQDGNGLPDAWEILYFGQLGVDPAADGDGDGMLNSKEYLAGTDPMDPDSHLAIWESRLDAEQEGHMVLSWPSVAGRVYEIWCASNLFHSSARRMGDVPATPPMNTYVDPMPEHGTGLWFYHIRVFWPQTP